MKDDRNDNDLEIVKTIKKAFKLGYYNYVKECSKQLEYNDKNLFKGRVKNSFHQNLAIQSEDTGYVSKDGIRIKYSYTSWREEFFKSTDRKNLKFFTSLYRNTGVMCFRIYNFGTEKYDYIISLNKDTFTHFSNDIFSISFAHEMGHCLLDHPSNPLPDNIERDIDREIAADNEGFRFLKESNMIDLNLYKDRENLVGSYGFNLKHVGNCGMVIYGPENIKEISKHYGCEEYQCLKQIANRFLKINSGQNDEEDTRREENFKKFLSENL